MTEEDKPTAVVRSVPIPWTPLHFGVADIEVKHPKSQRWWRILARSVEERPDYSTAGYYYYSSRPRIKHYFLNAHTLALSPEKAVERATKKAVRWHKRDQKWIQRDANRASKRIREEIEIG